MEYRVLKRGAPGYPARLLERLGDEAPAELYIHGPLWLLDRFTLGVICTDDATGQGLWETNQLLFVVRDYPWNYLGGWMSVIETEIFRLGLYTKNENKNLSVSCATAKGIDTESWEEFLLDRFYPPLHDFPERPEYFHRAQSEQLLMVSVAPLGTKRWLRRNIMQRNLLVCALADLVFIPQSFKGKRTFITAKRVVKMGVPCFTLAADCNSDLHQLGVPGFTRKNLKKFLDEMVAKVGPRTQENFPPRNPFVEVQMPTPPPLPKPSQLPLGYVRMLDKPPAKGK